MNKPIKTITCFSLFLHAKHQFKSDINRFVCCFLDKIRHHQMLQSSNFYYVFIVRFKLLLLYVFIVPLNLAVIKLLLGKYNGRDDPFKAQYYYGLTTQ